MSKKGERFITEYQYSSIVHFKQFKWIIKNVDECSLYSISSGEFTMGSLCYYDSFSHRDHTVPLTWTIELSLVRSQPLKIYLVLQDFAALASRTITIKCAFKIDHENITINSILEGTFYKAHLKKLVEGVTIIPEDLKNSNLIIAVSLLQNGYGDYSFY